MEILWNPRAVLGLEPSAAGGRCCIGTVGLSSPFLSPIALASPLPTQTSFPSLTPFNRLQSPERRLPLPRGLSASPGLQQRRCTRAIQPMDLTQMNKLLDIMARQMPDEIDHTMLLQLAKASLCAENPGPHRGVQEADVVYGWTSLLLREATALRARQAHVVAVEDFENLKSVTPTNRAAHTFLSISR
jgi:hypothetical protein